MDILQSGTVPEYHVMEGGIITVNTETAAALGIDTSVFSGMAGTVVEVATPSRSKGGTGMLNAAVVQRAGAWLHLCPGGHGLF